jgi:hypothetical protein
MDQQCRVGIYIASSSLVIVVCDIAPRTEEEVILANEKAVDDCERTRRPNYYEPDVVTRRVSLYRSGPHLESHVRKM